MRRSLRLLFAAAALVMVGCVGELADLVSLQRELLNSHPGTDITVTVRERGHLRINMRNSSAAELSEVEQEAIARAIGKLALEHYSGASRLSEISIVFGTIDRTGPLGITTDLDSYSYTPDQLADSAPSPPSDVVEASPVAS